MAPQALGTVVLNQLPMHVEEQAAVDATHLVADHVFGWYCSSFHTSRHSGDTRVGGISICANKLKSERGQ
jgi:hypothetical protein